MKWASLLGLVAVLAVVGATDVQELAGKLAPFDAACPCCRCAGYGAPAGGMANAGRGWGIGRMGLWSASNVRCGMIAANAEGAGWMC